MAPAPAEEVSDGLARLVVEGCSQREIFTIEAVICLAVLVRNIGLPWIFLGGRFNKSTEMFWLKFLLDCMFLVVPGILLMTFLSNSITVFAIVLATTAAVLMFFVLCEYLVCPDRVALKDVLNKLTEEHYRPTTFVTYFRGSMLILISIAILAVDFTIFPDRFKKTEHYGHSLMDIGVAACVFADAVGSRLKTSSMMDLRETEKRSWKRVLLSSKLILPLIGLTRTFVVWMLSYHQPVTEYGVHWNFFYTLGAIRIASWILPKKFPLLTSILFIIFQQCLLLHGWEDFVLFKHNPRDSLLLQNAEGIVSLMGYIALHYASIAIAQFISQTGLRVRAWIDCTIKLFALSFLLFLAQLFLEKAVSLPSRRVCNITYIVSQLSLLVFGLACFLFTQMFNIVAWAAKTPHFSSSEFTSLSQILVEAERNELFRLLIKTHENPFHGSQSDLLDSVNKNGLWFFLLSNLLTGLVNITMVPAQISSLGAVFILTLYIVICCLIVHFPSFLAVKRKV